MYKYDLGHILLYSVVIITLKSCTEREIDKEREREREREKERGRCLHLVTAAACGEEEDKRSLPLCFLSTLYSSHIVYSTARGLSWFFPLLWVFHVISCVSILFSVFCVDFVHTSSFRLWPNELANRILTLQHPSGLLQHVFPPSTTWVQLRELLS